MKLDKFQQWRNAVVRDAKREITEWAAEEGPPSMTMEEMRNLHRRCEQSINVTMGKMYCEAFAPGKAAKEEID